MSLTSDIRQKQIREMLDYDLVQNKRVFDSEVKHVHQMNESEAPPKKSDIEFESTLKAKVAQIVIQLRQLLSRIQDYNTVDSFSYTTRDEDASDAPQFDFDYGDDAETESGTDTTGFGKSGGAKSLRGLEIQKSKLEAKNKIDTSISEIYSQFNSLVDSIKAKIDKPSGMSSQGISNILSLLTPMSDAAKEVLSGAIYLKPIDTQLYNKTYNLLYEMVQSIDSAPPLLRLDVLNISDSHYVGPDDINFDYKKEVSLERYYQLKNEAVNVRQNLDRFERSPYFNPDDEGYKADLSIVKALEADLRDYEDKIGDLGHNTVEADLEALSDPERLVEMAIQKESIRGRISQLEDNLEASNVGIRKMTASQRKGIELRIKKLKEQLVEVEKREAKENLAYDILTKNAELYQRGVSIPYQTKLHMERQDALREEADLARRNELFNRLALAGTAAERRMIEDEISEEDLYAQIERVQGRLRLLDPADEDNAGQIEEFGEYLGYLQDTLERKVADRARLREAIRRAPPGVARYGPGANEFDGELGLAAEEPPGGYRYPPRGPQPRPAGVAPDRARIEEVADEEDADIQPRGWLDYLFPSRQRNRARGEAERRAREEAERIDEDELFEDAREGPDEEGFGKRRKNKKGGAKAMSPDQIHSIVMQRNKAFAANNEATQLPRAPMTYLAIKPDNSMGAGKHKKKDIVMKQKDFVKEHKKLVSLLGKTSNSLKSEAQEQTQELGKFDPETAKMLEKTVVKEKLKAGRKGKKSKQDLPTLVFDDKKNDWYL